MCHVHKGFLYVHDRTQCIEIIQRSVTVKDWLLASGTQTENRVQGIKRRLKRVKDQPPLLWYKSKSQGELLSSLTAVNPPFMRKKYYSSLVAEQQDSAAPMSVENLGDL